MPVSEQWQVLFARMRAWANEPGALLFPVVTRNGVVAIFPEEVSADDDILLALIEDRSEPAVAPDRRCAGDRIKDEASKSHAGETGSEESPRGYEP